MRTSIIKITIIFLFGLNSFAQSKLPECSKRIAYAKWSDCSGAAPYNNGAYVGDFKNGKPHGYGALSLGNGDWYSGNFANGNFYGHGKFMFRSKGAFDDVSGNYVNGVLSGQVIYNFKNGDSYSGEYNSGNFNGRGVRTYKNGDKDDGEFIDGKFIKGQSTRYFENGDKYVGNISNFKKHGQGVFYYSSGQKYHGDFSEDRRHGFGELFNLDGSVLSRGLWAFDEFVKPLNSNNIEGLSSVELEKMMYQSIELRRLSSLKKNFPVCVGAIATPLWNNCIGQYSFSNGKYTGEFVGGKGNGHGTYTSLDGSKYVGEFKEFNANSLGIEYDPSGAVKRSGIWRNNVLVSSSPLNLNDFPFNGLPEGVFDRLNAAATEAERLEKARIELEGDGSEADLECQAKKFKPSTKPYQRCLVIVTAKKIQEAAAEEKRENLKAEQERKRIAAETAIEERKQRAEMARADAEARRSSEAASSRISLPGFEPAQAKCIELGFKPKTEGFGKCVLQLSK